MSAYSLLHCAAECGDCEGIHRLLISGEHTVDETAEDNVRKRERERGREGVREGGREGEEGIVMSRLMSSRIPHELISIRSG